MIVAPWIQSSQHGDNFGQSSPPVSHPLKALVNLKPVNSETVGVDHVMCNGEETNHSVSRVDAVRDDDPILRFDVRLCGTHCPCGNEGRLPIVEWKHTHYPSYGSVAPVTGTLKTETTAR